LRGVLNYGTVFDTRFEAVLMAPAELRVATEKKYVPARRPPTVPVVSPGSETTMDFVRLVGLLP